MVDLDRAANNSRGEYCAVALAETVLCQVLAGDARDLREGYRQSI
jgi:hypothetical protein